MAKTSDRLKITFPAQCFDLNLLAPVIYVIVLNCFAIFLILNLFFKVSFPINIICGLFSLPCWKAIIGMTRAIIFGFFGEKTLYLDQEKIISYYRIFGFKYHNPPRSARKDIVKLELNKFSQPTDYELKKVKVAPAFKIKIWAGQNKYELNSLSKPELDWLATELSDWLNLPIVKE